ncbi:hypothetical protein PJP13_29365, partial [Mycobacterium kansasii]
FSDNDSTSEENLNSECEDEDDLQDAYNALYKESCKIVVKYKLQKEKFSKLKEGFESLILEKSYISDCFEKSKCDLEFKNSQICDLKSEVEKLKNEVSSLLSLKDT